VRSITITAMLAAALVSTAALAAPLQAAPRLPDTMIGYWCFKNPSDYDPDPDVTTLFSATSLGDCANHGSVHFRRGSRYQFGRFDWRANCQISKIEVNSGVYRIHSLCRSKSGIDYGEGPLEAPRNFEFWRSSWAAVARD
jgi:hypothetical protein